MKLKTYQLTPEKEIDNLEVLPAGMAAINSELNLFLAGEVKYFWIENFGERPSKDYVLMQAYLKKQDAEVRTDALELLGWSATVKVM